MNQADRIRQFILERYIESARAAGWQEVTIRAGDVHKEMRLAGRIPAVCSALEGRKLQEHGGITVTHRAGPMQGANVFVTFRLQPGLATSRRAKPTAPARRPRTGPAARIDPATSVVLVSCVKSKRARSTQAQDLYTSTLFQGARDFARASGAPWYILSAKYGLVHPDEVIAPYEYTLNRLGVAARRAWANKVLDDLLPKMSGRKTAIFLAGMRYREFLVGPVEAEGITVEVPMEGLRFGEQLQWLTANTWRA